MKDNINVGGFEPLTTIDFPDHLSCVVFTQGCPWRCRYCHNHDLIPANKTGEFNWDDIVKFIKSRKGLLDAVVFSGGEPLLQKNLLDSIKQIKNMGFKIGLHTTGAYPDRFKKVLPHIDWVGFDIKHLPFKYELITQTKLSGEKAFKSLELLINSNIEYELRLTRHPSLIDDVELAGIKRLVKKNYGVDVKIQRCNTNNCLDPELKIV